MIIKKMAVLLAAVLISTNFIGCSSSTASNEIKIGLAAPLTGGSAQDGQSIQKGVELAVKMANEAGTISGKTLSVVTEDDKGDPSEAATVANKLAQDKSIAAIVGHFNSSATLAGAPIYNSSGVAHISPGSSAASVTNAGDYTFRVITTDAVQGAYVADWAAKDLGAKKIAILYENTDYGLGLAQVLQESAGNVGASIVMQEAYEVGSSDFSTVLTKLASTDADLLFIGGLYNETALIAKQLKKFAMEDLKIMGVDAIYSDALINLGGADVEGVLLTGYFHESAENKVAQDFIAAYKKEYNETPGTYAAYAYDATLIIIDAIKNVGNDRSAIQKHIAGLKNFQGATGVNTFDENGDVLKDPLRLTIKDGKFTIIK